MPPQQRRYVLGRVGAFFAPPIAIDPVFDSSVIVIGEFSKASGLGEGARIMYQSLVKHHISVHYIDVDPYVFSLERFGKAYQVLSAHPHATLIVHFNSPQMAFVLLNLPVRLLKYRKIIGYWAWELLVLPKTWKIGFQFVHEIWVPSSFVARAIQPWVTKYHKPLKVVPHPLNDQPSSPYAGMNRETLGLPTDRLIVLTSFNLSSSFSRKNPLGAIRAFRKACKDIPNHKICLVLKMTYTENHHEDLERIRQAVQDMPNVFIFTDLLTDAENRALIACSDIILSLHRSEGFGLFPAEAMQAGKAVIATDWSATSEFINQSCGIPIDYSLISVSDTRMVYEIKNAYWADPDCDMAARAINLLFYNENYRNMLGNAARKNIRHYCNSKILLKALSGDEAVQAYA